MGLLKPQPRRRPPPPAAAALRLLWSRSGKAFVHTDIGWPLVTRIPLMRVESGLPLTWSERSSADVVGAVVR